jgi:hypothetical protein
VPRLSNYQAASTQLEEITSGEEFNFRDSVNGGDSLDSLNNFNSPGNSLHQPGGSSKRTAHDIFFFFDIINSTQRCCKICM